METKDGNDEETSSDDINEDEERQHEPKNFTPPRTVKRIRNYSMLQSLRDKAQPAILQSPSSSLRPINQRIRFRPRPTTTTSTTERTTRVLPSSYVFNPNRYKSVYYNRNLYPAPGLKVSNPYISRLH